MGQEVDPGDINSGLPSPDNRLGKPAKYEKVLGTPGSGFHLKSYCLYLCEFEEKYKTTENAWTLRFFGIFMNPEVWPEELRPPRYPDCRVVQSDKADIQSVKDSYEPIPKYSKPSYSTSGAFEGLGFVCGAKSTVRTGTQLR